jgi:(p)ppGpp synthase/HD superfamily hydrolase
MIEKEARKFQNEPAWRPRREKIQAILPDYGAGKVDDLLALIGYGRISAKQVLVRIAPDGAETVPAADESRFTTVVKRVLGLGTDAKLKFAASTTCWYIGQSAAIRFVAKKSSDTLRGAKA